MLEYNLMSEIRRAPGELSDQKRQGGRESQSILPLVFMVLVTAVISNCGSTPVQEIQKSRKEIQNTLMPEDATSASRSREQATEH